MECMRTRLVLTRNDGSESHGVVPLHGLHLVYIGWSCLTYKAQPFTASWQLTGE